MLLIACAVVLLLVVLNGVFAMSELAVVSSRKAKLQSRAEKGDEGAAEALRLAEDPTRFLSAVQVGITLIGILAGAYGQATIAGELQKSIAGLKGLEFVHEHADIIATTIANTPATNRYKYRFFMLMRNLYQAFQILRLPNGQ